jgi:hypothetical protein
VAVAKAKVVAWTITGSAIPVEERTGAAVTRAKVAGRITGGVTPVGERTGAAVTRSKVAGRITGSVTPVEEIVAAAVGAMGAGIARPARAAVDALPVR